MYKRFMFAAALVGGVAATAWATGMLSEKPCSCCEVCVCTACACDELGCSCGTGGDCVCSTDCCTTCCSA